MKRSTASCGARTSWGFCIRNGYLMSGGSPIGPPTRCGWPSGGAAPRLARCGARGCATEARHRRSIRTLFAPSISKRPCRATLRSTFGWQRRLWIDTRVEALRQTAGSAVSRIEQGALTSLGVDFTVLIALDAARAKGEDITGRLDQYGLGFPAFTRLISVHALAAKNIAVPPAEWEAVYSILVQAEKVRRFSAWRDEEMLHDILLGPDGSQSPANRSLDLPPPKAWEPTAWRSTYEIRGDWDDTLQSRIDEDASIKDGLNTIVSAVEEVTLPSLRDGIINFRSGANVNDLAGKAKWFADHLLVDTQAGGCQRTTRIALAIEVLQRLLWALRTGQLAAAYPNLTLENYEPATGAQSEALFDEDWRWIGSYAMWRAASFVFLYPENILIPTLRSKQTPGFRALASDLRARPQLTPEQACQAAQTYADYFRDVCSLDLQACETASTAISTGSCRDQTVPEAPRDFEYLFAVSRISQRVYWSRVDPNPPDASYGRTFWSAVPGVTYVLDLIGAILYEKPGATDERWVFLFYRHQDDSDQQLAFVRFDLKRGDWRDAVELEVPDKSARFTARLSDTHASSPPRVVLTLPDSTTYTRELNGKGDAWASSDFQRAFYVDINNVPLRALPRFSDPSDSTFKRAGVRMGAANKYVFDNSLPYTSAFPNFLDHANDENLFGLSGYAATVEDLSENDILGAALDLGLPPCAVERVLLATIQ